MASVNRKIARTAMLLIIVNIFGYGLSLFKEILVASRFGILKEMDAFFAASSVPNLLSAVFTSTIGVILIPIFIKFRGSTDDESSRSLSNCFNMVTLTLIAVSLFLCLLAPLFVRLVFYGLPQATAATATELLRLLSFMVVFYGMTSVLTSIYNAKERFLFPALTSMAVSICTIAAVMTLYERLGIFALAIGFVTGVVVQAGLLILFKGRALSGYRFSIDLRDPAVKEMFTQSRTLLVLVVAFQANILIDRIVASFLPPGSMAALGYADKLVQVPLIIFTGSMATALLPYLSMQASEHKFLEMKDSLAKSIRMAGLIFIPLTLLLILYSKPIISLLFERGAFDAAATGLTSIILALYSLQLFFYAVCLIFGRTFIALQRLRPFVVISLVSVVLNIAGNITFIHVIKPPVAGIALATSLVFAITSILYARAIHGALEGFPWKYIFNGLARIVVATIIAGLVSYKALSLHLFEWVGSPVLREGLRVFEGITVTVVIFALIAHYILNLEEIRKMWRVALPYNP